MKLFKSKASKLIDKMNEKRPLPLGMHEFEAWSDRIMSGALLPATRESQQFALASMLMHLGPTVDHETDGYFIKSLRKGAINEIAHAKMQEIKEAQKKRIAEETKNEDQRKLAVVTDTVRGITDGRASGTEEEREPLSPA